MISVWRWIQNNANVISALGSLAMLVVWLLYLQLFYREFRLRRNHPGRRSARIKGPALSREGIFWNRWSGLKFAAWPPTPAMPRLSALTACLTSFQMRMAWHFVLPR